MRASWIGSVVAISGVLFGCSGSDEVGVYGSNGDTATITATIGDGDGDGDGDTNGDGDGDGDDTGGVKLDVGGQGTAEEGEDSGCEKVDFLFIVDNSGSMEDEQVNLATSFEGFIEGIQGTLMAQDYHIMVVDTDAESLSFSGINCVNNVCSCEPEPQCCYALCANMGPIMINPPPTECGGVPCDEFELPTGCDVTLGAGKEDDPVENPCGIAGDKRYIQDGQPDLVGTFQCMAQVGAGGDGNERPMEAMTEGIGPLIEPGECNEGFLRDDAILVVTFITDEEDEGSMGNPASWKQALVAAKGGNEDAIVMLGIFGDTGEPNAVCNDQQAEPAPNLRQFAESFSKSAVASVCENDYTPFFLAAVETIDVTCDEFNPEG